MSVANFIPEIWNAAIKSPYEKNLVYGQSTIASNAWMGEITGIGDTVHISAITAPTIKEIGRASCRERV